eukprot:CAMPEP_0198522210 /NCGR_PEP_ID=MMETSP1462-20131121/21401_1 /TAXON_ID=1333877 /ORGANISM="Brandtodinium nutriculum, Strain RCC3387" /LENGTH=176 /DNA_ID=CAMNT_0044251867 /DNA_START=136 /DNA_END=662 /DNA_ORIENTATION=+
MDHVGAKDEADAPVVLGPARNVLVWVGPQQVADQPGVWHVRRADELPDLVHVRQLGRQAAVHADDFFVDEPAHWQAIEDVAEVFPQLDVVPSLALIVEAVNPGDRRALMVSAQQEKILWIFGLVGEHQRDRFEGLLAPVDVIAQEDVIALWGEEAVLEDAQEIVVLPVDVPADLQR